MSYDTFELHHNYLWKYCSIYTTYTYKYIFRQSYPKIHVTSSQTLTERFPILVFSNCQLTINDIYIFISINKILPSIVYQFDNNLHLRLIMIMKISTMKTIDRFLCLHFSSCRSFCFVCLLQSIIIHSKELYIFYCVLFFFFILFNMNKKKKQKKLF